jgi:hypothetical protein
MALAILNIVLGIGLPLAINVLEAKLAPHDTLKKTANVRIYAGLNGPNSDHPAFTLYEADGYIGEVQLFDQNQNLLGTSDPGVHYVENAGFADISVTTGEQAVFSQITADSSICIPLVSLTTADGTQYSWTGEWGRVCGLQWYFSNIVVDDQNT